MKASFFRRLAAYLFDVLFISIVASVIASGISSTKYEEAYKEYEDVMGSYTSGELEINKYAEQLGEATYNLQKASIPTTSITLMLSIVYFIVFQYLNKGQTLGKKLLRLKVQENGKEPSIKAMIIRTFFIDSIFSTLCAIILVYSLNKNNFYSVYNVVTLIETVFVFTSVLFILYRKDKLGLHDVIAHTEVIKVIDERGK